MMHIAAATCCGPAPSLGALALKLLPLDRPTWIELAANWLGREENYKWLDFGEGARALSVMSLRFMTQRVLHAWRLSTPEDTDWPIGFVGLPGIRRRSKTAGPAWPVPGRNASA